MSPASRKTVNLTPKANEALGRILDSGVEANQTDAINRALRWYEAMVRIVEAGGKVVFVSKDGGEEVVKVL